MKFSAVFYLTIIIIFTGCSSQLHVQPFTKDMIKEYKLDEDGIKALQLYISHNLRLEREVKDVDKNIDNNSNLLTIEDKLIERIDFKRNTPCIVMSANADKLKVGFELKDNIIFSLKEKHEKGKVFCYEPDQPISTKYREGRSMYRIYGSEHYADTTYIAKITNDLPYLLISENSLKSLEIKARNVPGLLQPSN